MASAGSRPYRYVSVVPDLPTGTGGTPYLAIGDAFGWLTGLLGLTLVGGASVRRHG